MSSVSGPPFLLVAAGAELQDIFGDLDQGLVVGDRADVGENLGICDLPALGDVSDAVFPGR
jgi:hypothetical protein